MIVKRLGPLSFAKITAVLYAMLGFIVGCFVALLSMAGAMATREGLGPIAGLVFGVGAIVFLPILYGAIGFVMTLIMSALYNLVASWIGGVEIEVEHPIAGIGSPPGA